LETGIRIIDADYRDLVKLINLLALSVERSRPTAKMRILVDQFNQYAVEHFMRE
jgi:hemerythrin